MLRLPAESSPKTLPAHALALAATLALLCSPGCAAPQDLFTTPTETTEEVSSASDGSAKVGEAVEHAVDVEQIDSYLSRARRALGRNFEGFLEREPLGFDLALFSEFWEEVEEFGGDLVRANETFSQRTALDIFRSTIPLLLVVLIAGLFTLLDRQARAMAQRTQARQRTPRLQWVGVALRAGTLLLGELGALSAVLLVSYFPIRAIFGALWWTIMLTGLLWVMFAYRAIAWAIEIVFGLFLVDTRDVYADDIRWFLRGSLQLSMCFVVPMTVADSIDWRPEVPALLQFALGLTAAALPAYLFRHRESFFALFPDEGRSSTYTFLRQTFERNFTWLLTLTMLLLAMRAFGFVRSATFMLVRGYGLFALLLGTFLLLSQSSRFFDRREEELELGDPQRELLDSIDRLFTLGALVTSAVLSMKIFTLYDPALILLKTPLLTVQSVRFSIFNVLSAALIVGASLLASKIVRAVLNAKVYPSLDVEIGVAYAVNTVLNYAIVVLGFFLVLIALGVNLSALTVVLASLSVGIGFGLQTLTENLISGFIILFGRTVRKGDFVSVGEIYGRVEAVGARSVVVRSMDNYDVLIPSKELVGGQIINWTYRDTLARLHIPVGVTYKADMHRVKGALLEAAKRHPNALDLPEPEVWLVEFGDNSVNFELLVYYDCSMTNASRLKGEINFHIWDALEEADIEIPFPQRDLHIRSADILPQLGEMFGGPAAPRGDGAEDDPTLSPPAPP